MCQTSVRAGGDEESLPLSRTNTHMLEVDSREVAFDLFVVLAREKYTVL